MTKTVYLAGPISGLTFDGAEEWRLQAKSELAAWGIHSLDPLRGKQYLADLGVLQDAVVESGSSAYLEREDWPLSRPAGITARDRNDVMTCDLVLANMEHAPNDGVFSIGTVIEIGWADAFRKPIVVVAPKGSIYRHAMVERMAGFLVESLDSALEIIPAILNAEKLAPAPPPQWRVVGTWPGQWGPGRGNRR